MDSQSGGSTRPKKNNWPVLIAGGCLILCCCIGLIGGAFAIASANGASGMVGEAARDSQRRLTLMDINRQIVAYYANQNSYPLLNQANGISFKSNGVFIGKSIDTASPTVSLIGSLKPSSYGVVSISTSTVYCYKSTGKNYVIGAKLEQGTKWYYLSSDISGPMSQCDTNDIVRP
jgi:hypothetical protein